MYFPMDFTIIWKGSWILITCEVRTAREWWAICHSPTSSTMERTDIPQLTVRQVGETYVGDICWLYDMGNVHGNNCWRTGSLPELTLNGSERTFTRWHYPTQMPSESFHPYFQEGFTDAMPSYQPLRGLSLIWIMPSRGRPYTVIYPRMI